MTTDLRLGIVGVDTSHAEQFTARLNDPAHPGHVAGARVVAAFPLPSLDLPESRDRVGGFTTMLRERFAVRIASSLEDLCTSVDAILLLAFDGRPRLEIMRRLIAQRKPVFMDKPVAASLADTVAIYALAADAGVPVFSASAIRWYAGVQTVATASPIPATGAISYGPAHILPGHPDLFFYGIHPTEALFTVIGPGCLSVTRTTTPSASVVTGLWDGGRTGVLYAIHEGAKAYKVVRFGPDGIVEQTTEGDYTPLLREIVSFFRSGVPPVSARETVAIYAFMAAADESKHRGGTAVSLREVLETAGAPEVWLPAAPPTATDGPQPTAAKNLPLPGSGQER